MFMKEAGAVLFRSPVMTLAEPDTVQYSLRDEVNCLCVTGVVKGIISEDKSSSALTIYEYMYFKLLVKSKFSHPQTIRFGLEKCLNDEK